LSAYVYTTVDSGNNDDKYIQIQILLESIPSMVYSHSHLSFLNHQKTAAKHNTRKQSNVTMWNIKKLH